MGYARFEDIKTIGSKINDFDDYVNAFTTASEIALREGRLKNAATYCQASEFLISPSDPDKISVYNKFIRLFEKLLQKTIMNVTKYHTRIVSCRQSKFQPKYLK